MKNFLRTNKTKIVSKGGKLIQLKGVNLGGWLMMEAYILHAPNFPEQTFKKEFVEALGEKALYSFEKEYREHFIREADIKNISRLGFNCVRVPFNYRLIGKTPYRYDKEGVQFLDQVIRWAKKYGIWVILDLHAAQGSQNCDWHADSTGRAELWTKKEHQERVFALWEFLADRYESEESVAGYDLLNEAVLEDPKLLNRFYKKAIKRIRSVDENHILFIEGNKWATDVDCLEEYHDDNYVLSIHNYDPLDFVLNFVPHLSYPFKPSEGGWNEEMIRRNLSRYQKISQKREIPFFAGEFGVNARQGLFGEDRWLADILKCFNDFGFHWTYWTYKAIKGPLMPDGIYSYVENPPWVNRIGPLTGWDTYKQHWPAQQNAMIHSWHTDQFQANKEILKVLRDALR
ncbi:MAG: glycoside hydrolase family 5 protein [Candidatus Omnitrophica bacterium]|nr:glycoside hydrolase family 5 protein [Candidatus Omnitrophota bacterium]